MAALYSLHAAVVCERRCLPCLRPANSWAITESVTAPGADSQFRC